jgi:hypothetical protein
MVAPHNGSKITLKKASADDFSSVYGLFLDFNDHNLSRENWNQLFKPHWDYDEGYYGYILLEDNLPIGFLSTIFSQRLINNKYYRFCNLSSWIVKDGYRNRSLYMIQPLLKLKNYTITLLTPSEITEQVFAKLGYKQLDSGIRILLPIPQFGGYLKNKLQIIFDRKVIKGLLNDNELKIFHDHAEFNCIHAMICSYTGHCYMIMRKIIRKQIPFAYIHYVSNFEVFNQMIDRLRISLAMKLKVIGIIIDERFVHDCNMRFFIKYPRVSMYKSPDLEPKDIDSLYSEYFLLDLP